jgi:hypothetical protein
MTTTHTIQILSFYIFSGYTIAYSNDYSFYMQHTCNQHAFRSKRAIGIEMARWKVGLLGRYSQEYHHVALKQLEDLLICDHVDNVI